jgi:Spy/CpxP family protein refolding chaperone
LPWEGKRLPSGPWPRSGQQALFREEMMAFARVLTPDQLVKLPAVLREELQQWRTPTAWREHLNAIAEELGLTREQKEQIKKIQEASGWTRS